MNMNEEFLDILYAVITNKTLQYSVAGKWKDIEPEDYHKVIGRWRATKKLYELRVKPEDIIFKVGDKFRFYSRELMLIHVDTQTDTSTYGLLDLSSGRMFGRTIFVSRQIDDISLYQLEMMCKNVCDVSDLVLIKE